MAVSFGRCDLLGTLGEVGFVVVYRAWDAARGWGDGGWRRC